MDKVSIIVPVYNVEQYLERCVESLLGQSYENVEVILIDDGSPDQSGAICDSLSNKDQRIKVIHQQNQGVSAARNAGLKAMTGEWVCFCDGDDWYEADFVEKMLACAQKEQADYIICNYKIAAEGRGDLVSGSIDGLYSGCDNKLVIAIGPTSSCTHMIHRSLFEVSGVGYPVGCPQYEELPVIPVLAKYSQKIGVVNEPLYNYYQRGDGTSASNKSNQSEKNFLFAWNMMSESLGKGYDKETEYHIIYALFYGEVLQLCKQRQATKEIKKKIKGYMDRFPEIRKNPYIAHMGIVKRVFLQMVSFRFVLGLRIMAWVHGKIVN